MKTLKMKIVAIKPDKRFSENSKNPHRYACPKCMEIWCPANLPGGENEIKNFNCPECGTSVLEAK
jgi:hypothetical protein